MVLNMTSTSTYLPPPLSLLPSPSSPLPPPLSLSLLPLAYFLCSLRELQKETEELKAELRGLEEELEYHRESQVSSSDPDDQFVLVMNDFARKATATFANLDSLIRNMMEEVRTGDSCHEHSPVSSTVQEDCGVLWGRPCTNVH